jgi:hypothetical protein
MFIALLGLLPLAGCNREPPIAKANVKIVSELKTAVAAKKTDWLEAAAKHIDEHRQKGQLSEGESAALKPVVELARGGKWDEANAKLKELIDGQRAP